MGRGGHNYFKSVQTEYVVPDFFYSLKAKFLRTKIAKQAFYVSCGIPARKQQQGIWSVGADLISISHGTSLNELQKAISEFPQASVSKRG